MPPEPPVTNLDDFLELLKTRTTDTQDIVPNLDILNVSVKELLGIEENTNENVTKTSQSLLRILDLAKEIRNYVEIINNKQLQLEKTQDPTTTPANLTTGDENEPMSVVLDDSVYERLEAILKPVKLLDQSSESITDRNNLQTDDNTDESSDKQSETLTNIYQQLIKNAPDKQTQTDKLVEKQKEKEKEKLKFKDKSILQKGGSTSDILQLLSYGSDKLGKALPKAFTGISRAFTGARNLGRRAKAKYKGEQYQPLENNPTAPKWLSSVGEKFQGLSRQIDRAETYLTETVPEREERVKQESGETTEAIPITNSLLQETVDRMKETSETQENIQKSSENMESYLKHGDTPGSFYVADIKTHDRLDKQQETDEQLLDSIDNKESLEITPGQSDLTYNLTNQTDEFTSGRGQRDISPKPVPMNVRNPDEFASGRGQRDIVEKVMPVRVTNFDELSMHLASELKRLGLLGAGGGLGSGGMMAGGEDGGGLWELLAGGLGLKALRDKWKERQKKKNAGKNNTGPDGKPKTDADGKPKTRPTGGGGRRGWWKRLFGIGAVATATGMALNSDEEPDLGPAPGEPGNESGVDPNVDLSQRDSPITDEMIIGTTVGAPIADSALDQVKERVTRPRPAKKSSWWDRAKSWGSDKVKSAKSKVNYVTSGNAWKDTKQSVKSGVNSVKKGISSASDWADDKVDSAKKGLTSAGDYISEKASGAKQWAGDKVDSAKKGLTSAGDWMGKQYDTAAKGVSAAGDWVGNKTDDIIKGAKSAGKYVSSGQIVDDAIAVGKKGISNVQEISGKAWELINDPKAMKREATKAAKSMGKAGLKTVLSLPVVDVLIESVFGYAEVQDILKDPNLSAKEKKKLVGQVISQGIAGVLGGAIAAGLVNMGNATGLPAFLLTAVAYTGGDIAGRYIADALLTPDMEVAIGEAAGDVFGIDYGEEQTDVTGDDAAKTDIPTPDVPTPDVPTPDIPTPDIPTPDVQPDMANESPIPPEFDTPGMKSPFPRITIGEPVLTREPNYDMRKPQTNRLHDDPRGPAFDSSQLDFTPHHSEGGIPFEVGPGMEMPTAYSVDGFNVSEEEFLDYADTGLYPDRITKSLADDRVYFIEDENGRRQVTKEDYIKQIRADDPDSPFLDDLESLQATPKLGDLPGTTRPVPKTTPTTNRVKDLINSKPTTPGSPVSPAVAPASPTSMVEPDIEQTEPTLMARAGESLNIAKNKVMSTPYLGSTLAAASKGASAMYDGVAKFGGYQDPKEKEENNKPIVMNNSTSSSTNNTTTINKYDTDTISKWRSGYVDQVHKPGHYSLYS